MPNKKSAIKRLRSDAKKRSRNQSVLSELHSRFKQLTTLAGQDANAAKEYARVLVSKFDKAVVHGILPHGRANRKKARIARLLSSTKKPSA